MWLLLSLGVSTLHIYDVFPWSRAEDSGVTGWLKLFDILINQVKTSPFIHCQLLFSPHNKFLGLVVCVVECMYVYHSHTL